MDWPPRRSLAFLAAWLAGLALLAWAGTEVDGYALHVMHVPLPHPYPLAGVLRFAGLMTVELAIVYGILRPRTFDRSVGRLAVACGLGLPYALLLGVLTMHSPPYVAFHWLWFVLIEVALFVALLLVSAQVLLGKRASVET